MKVADQYEYGFRIWLMRDKIDPKVKDQILKEMGPILMMLVNCECEPPDHACGPDCVCLEMEEL